MGTSRTSPGASVPFISVIEKAVPGLRSTQRYSAGMSESLVSATVRSTGVSTLTLPQSTTSAPSETRGPTEVHLRSIAKAGSLVPATRT